jgi:hypothetical protein
MKYEITVVAIVGANATDLVLYSNEVYSDMFNRKLTFLDWLKKNFPLLKWEFDDGMDFDEWKATDYIQYVAYCDERKTNSYVLATLYEEVIT